MSISFFTQGAFPYKAPWLLFSLSDCIIKQRFSNSHIRGTRGPATQRLQWILKSFWRKLSACHMKMMHVTWRTYSLRLNGGLQPQFESWFLLITFVPWEEVWKSFMWLIVLSHTAHACAVWLLCPSLCARFQPQSKDIKIKVNRKLWIACRCECVCLRVLVLWWRPVQGSTVA